jgi:hypothetical protein
LAGASGNEFVTGEKPGSSYRKIHDAQSLETIFVNYMINLKSKPDKRKEEKIIK